MWEQCSWTTSKLGDATWTSKVRATESRVAEHWFHVVDAVKSVPQLRDKLRAILDGILNAPMVGYDTALMEHALESLEAFYLAHRLCGALDGGVDLGSVWLACSVCNAVIAQAK
jgi:hypothetical protein